MVAMAASVTLIFVNSLAARKRARSCSRARRPSIQANGPAGRADPEPQTAIVAGCWKAKVGIADVREAEQVLRRLEWFRADLTGDPRG